MTAQLIPVVNHFSEVDTHMADIKDKLQNAEMTTASMSAVERYVKEGMQEMGRKLIQALTRSSNWKSTGNPLSDEQYILGESLCKNPLLA